MNRRRFLIGGVAATTLVVGCVGRGPGSGGPTAGETSLRTKTAGRTNDGTNASEIQRRVSLAGVDEVPAKYEVSIGVKLLESTVTAAHTARLRITTTNEGPKRKISIAKDGCSLFNRSAGLSENPGLILKPSSDTKWIDRRGDLWVPDRPSDQPRDENSYGCLYHRYSEKDSLSNDYLVWDDYQVTGYMTPGTYRFAELVAIAGPNTEVAPKPSAEFTWGFSLTVEKP